MTETYLHVARKATPKYNEPILTRGASGISVFRNASPAVVLIFVGEVKNDQFDPTGMGSGVVISSTGDILTNWHVINGHAAAVIFYKPQGNADPENSTPYVANLVAQSEVVDLALLHLTEAPPSKVSIPIGNISSVQVAEDIHVIGHPEGNPWSYSTGVVSQVRDGYGLDVCGRLKTSGKGASNYKRQSNQVILEDPSSTTKEFLGLIAHEPRRLQNLDYAVAADVIQSFLANKR